MKKKKYYTAVVSNRVICVMNDDRACAGVAGWHSLVVPVPDRKLHRHHVMGTVRTAMQMQCNSYSTASDYEY